MRSPMMYLLTSLGVLMGYGAITCVLVWKIYIQKDDLTSWTDNPSSMFNWHPILMTLAIFFMGFGTLIYRLLSVPRAVAKSVHALMMVLSMGAGAIGLWAVLDSHLLANPPKPNFYSLHSWIGIFTLGLLAFQFLAGFLMFLFPCCKSIWKLNYLPVHKYMGSAILASATGSALMGIVENVSVINESRLAVQNATLYTYLGEEEITINVFGCSLFLFSAIIIFITTFKEFRVFK